VALELVQKSAESRLLTMVGELRKDPDGWQALHLHLSDLLEEYKSEYQFKIALNLIQDLLKNYEGALFPLVDQSILILCRDVVKAVMDKLIFQLRYLYMDDPLCYNNEGEPNPAFSTCYDLMMKDWKTLDTLCIKYKKMSLHKASPKTSATGTESDGPQLSSKPVMDVKSVAHAPQLISGAPPDRDVLFDEPRSNQLRVDQLKSVEEVIRKLDMREVIRRQPICAMLADKKVRWVLDELYVHIAQVKKTLSSDAEFFTNRWLLKYVTVLLDRRMLEWVRNNQATYLTKPISLNLNVETLLSSHFNEFDRSIKPEAKIAIVVEIPVLDVFADMGAFRAARAEMQRLGYRICLDGVTPESFLYIDREKLGLDLIKLQWNADKKDDITSQNNSLLAEAVKSTGGNRVILCRCDDRSALGYGVALGISLFQGRILDRLLNPSAKVEN